MSTSASLDWMLTVYGALSGSMIKVASCGLKRGVESLSIVISQRVRLIYLYMKLSVFAFDILTPFLPQGCAPCTGHW